MLSDLLLFRLSKQMVAHHIVCLMSIHMCFFVYPEGFYYYALGVATLELGSASFNVALLGAPESIYPVAMTLSNVLSVGVFYYWMTSMTSWMGVILASILYGPIIYIRQV